MSEDEPYQQSVERDARELIDQVNQQDAERHARWAREAQQLAERTAMELALDRAREREETKASHRRRVRRQRYDLAVSDVISGPGHPAPTDELVAEAMDTDAKTLQRWRADGDIP